MLQVRRGARTFSLQSERIVGSWHRQRGWGERKNFTKKHGTSHDLLDFDANCIEGSRQNPTLLWFQVYKDCCTQAATSPYLTHRVNGSVHGLQFCPYEDVLGVGHATGFSSLLIPGIFLQSCNFSSQSHGVSITVCLLGCRLRSNYTIWNHPCSSSITML